MPRLLHLLSKDLKAEVRSKELLTLFALLAFLLSLLCVFGLNAAFVDPVVTRKLFPTMVWLVFLFSATLALTRLYESELEHMGYEGLLLLGVPAYALYLSKFFVVLILSSFSHLICSMSLAVLLNVQIGSILPEYLLLSGLVIVAYAGLAVLVAGMSATSRIKGMLLPLILLPLLFPVFFAALELSSELLAKGKLPLGSFWLSLLVCLDFLYLALGCTLFESVIRD
jgi:heme exporter protein B